MQYLIGGALSDVQAVALAIFTALVVMEFLKGDIRGTMLMSLLVLTAVVPVAGVTLLVIFAMVGGLNVQE